jgi:RND family efflux transporter MFP subunit
MKKRPLIYTGGAALLILLIVAVRLFTSRETEETRRQNVPLVKVETPLRDTVNVTLQFTGDVLAIQQAAIFAKVTGNIERIYADIGARVSRGQVLALIDTTELYQTYEQAIATSENANLNFRRTRELFDQNLVSKQDLDNAEAAHKIAKATFDAAATRLSYAKVTAPFSGYVTKRYLDAGALVSPNSSILFTLMDIDQMKIMINVLEKNIPLIKPGKKAMITVDAFPGRTFEGTVTRLSEAVDLATRTMAVEIDIPNADHTLKAGMFANVVLLIDQHPDAITVPTQVLQSDDSGPFLFVARQDTARRVNVTLGNEQEGRTEILSGVTLADSVITVGQQFVRNGGSVRVQH